MKRSEFFKTLFGACCAVPLVAKEKAKAIIGKPCLDSVTGTPFKVKEIKKASEQLLVRNSAGDVFPPPIDCDHYKFEADQLLHNEDGVHIGWDPASDHSYSFVFRSKKEHTLFTYAGGNHRVYINGVEEKNWKGFPSGSQA